MPAAEERTLARRSIAGQRGGVAVLTARWRAEQRFWQVAAVSLQRELFANRTASAATQLFGSGAIAPPCQRSMRSGQQPVSQPWLIIVVLSLRGHCL